MAQLQFIRAHGETELFDVVRDGESVGIVWLKGEVWYADRYNMGAPAFSGGAREEVVNKLLMGLLGAPSTSE